MKNTLIVLLVLLLLFWAWLILRWFGIFQTWINSTFQTWKQAIEKTVNADNAIYNYEWFKSQLNDIESIKIKIKNSQLVLQDHKDSLTWEQDYMDKQETARLRTINLWLMNQYEDMVAKYNARAEMATRNIFEDWVMPSFIDSFTFIKK